MLNPLTRRVCGAVESTEWVHVTFEGLDPERGVVTHEGGIIVVTADGRSERHFLRPGDRVECSSGEDLPPGAVVYLPRGLVAVGADFEGHLHDDDRPALEMLLGARRPTGMRAILAPVDGIVRVAGQGARRCFIETPAGVRRLHLGAGRRWIRVHDGDRVFRGQALTEGSIDHHALARLVTREEMARHLVDELVALYGRQGIRVVRHRVEGVVAEMMAWVKITAVGDGPFVKGARVPWKEVARCNAALARAGRAPAQCVSLLQGYQDSARTPGRTGG